MSGLLCPRLLNPVSRLASWMRANHKTTRDSRNEFSNIAAIEAGFHAKQVPNSCRKWHIYILVLIQSPLYMSHTSLRWVDNVLCFPSMPMQIEVWAVSNLTFVLLRFAIIYTLNARSSVQTLALYSRRSVTLKRVNGDATSAVCRLRKYVSEALHAIPNCLWIHEMLVRNAMKQKLLLNQIHIVEVCEAGWYKTFVRIMVYSTMCYYL